MSELALLLTHSTGHLSAQVIFIEPPGKDATWTHSNLWRQASELPATTLISDLGERETKLFHASTSGEIVVYDAEGKLIFHGGITGVRGHEGDNAGLSAVQSCVQTSVASLAQTPVFGCPLYSEAQTP